MEREGYSKTIIKKMHRPSIFDCSIPIHISSNQHFKFKAHYTFSFIAIFLVCRLSYDSLSSEKFYHIIETEGKNHTYIRGAEDIIELQRLSSSNFWKKIDLTKELSCGRYKCLFRDKMNEDIGYLIHSNHHTGTGIQFETESLIAWEVVEYMRSNFGIKHLYIDKPRKVKMIHMSESHNKTYTERKRSREEPLPMYYANQYAVVQKIQIAKDPWLIVMPPKGYDKVKHLFRERNNKSTHKSSFKSTLREDTMKAMKALQHIPLLADDYQIILDGGGNLYHFDIDRVFLGRFYHSQQFETTFIKNYDKSMDMLREMLTWTNGNASDEGNGYRSGEEIISEYHLKTRPLSCRALDTVRSMSGRIKRDRIVEEEDILNRKAMLMMIDTVEMILPDEMDKAMHCNLPMQKSPP